MVGLLCDVLKVTCCSFLNICSRNEIAILCSVDTLCLFSCFIGTARIQVTEGRKYRVTQKTGTFENPTELKHFYGESTLLTVPLTHDY